MMFLPVPNGRRVARARLPSRESGDWARDSSRLVDTRPVVVLPIRHADAWQFLWIVAEDPARRLLCTSVMVRGDRLRLLGERWPAASRLERELLSSTGLRSDGAERALSEREEPATPTEPAGAFDLDFGPGDDVVAPADVAPDDASVLVAAPTPASLKLGPVHGRAGAPMLLTLDGADPVRRARIELGFCHRGLVAALRHADTPGAVAMAGSLAGDAVIATTLAWCELLEGLSGVEVPPQVALPRAVLLEIERCLVHLDCLRLIMELIGHDAAVVPLAELSVVLRDGLAAATGSRVGRGVLWPGGLWRSLSTSGLDTAIVTLERGLLLVERQIESALCLSRLEGVGRISGADAQELGLVGPPGRASGAERDVRVHFPSGAWWEHAIRCQTLGGGDTLARVRLRMAELGASARWLRSTIARLGPAPAPATLRLHPESLGLAMVESARGELVMVAMTGTTGQIETLAVVDPTVKNLSGAEQALRGADLIDVPVILASFGLSPPGHDR